MQAMKKDEIDVKFYPEKTKAVILKCEVAKSYFDKMKGMMHKESLAENKGMIFPFLIPWHHFFWMKNVKIPLDIIFINRKFEIIWIHEAPVEKGLIYKMYWSHGFCKYIIETNKGFCKKHDIKNGTIVKIN